MDTKIQLQSAPWLDKVPNRRRGERRERKKEREKKHEGAVKKSCDLMGSTRVGPTAGEMRVYSSAQTHTGLERFNFASHIASPEPQHEAERSTEWAEGEAPPSSSVARP